MIDYLSSYHQAGKTAKLYCENGVRRFQVSDYGWGCREAMMLAYIRDGSDLMTELTPQITKKNTSGIAEFETITGPSIHVAEIEERASSQHDRSFLYPSRQPPHQESGPISKFGAFDSAKFGVDSGKGEK